MNTCKQIKVEYQNPTIMDMMDKITLLEQELSRVRAENTVLRNDNEILQFNNQLLHNSIEGKYEENDKVNDNEGGWTEDETLLMARIYEEAEKDYKL